MKKNNLLLCSLLLIIFLPAVFVQLVFAQWPSDPTVNVPVSRGNYQEQHPRSISDGADGAIIVWEAYIGSDYDLFAQRINADGSLSWSSDADICYAQNNQTGHSLTSDGAGGAIIVWNDQRNEPAYGDIYAQRVDASGNTMWTTNGIAICIAANVQGNPKIISDGTGGAIITWRDSRNSTQFGAVVDIYAQRINASGNIMWATNGVPVCSAAGNQLDPIIVSDDAGGAIIAWIDERDLTTLGRDVYAQRINASGVTQWTANGVGYKANGNQEWKGGSSPIASDGAGGAIIAWEDDYFGTNDIDIRCLRVDANGSFPWSPASSWVAGAGFNQVFPNVVYNGFNSVVITWTDYRNGIANPDIYAQRISSSGQQKWTGNWGVVVCNASDSQEGPQIINDDFGGVIVSWHDYRNNATSGADVYAQRLDSLGVNQWTANGAVISNANQVQDNPTLVRAGTCGAIIAWRDLRWVGHAWDDTDWDIYAQRIFCDGSLSQPLTVQEPNGGETWYVGSTNYEIAWTNQNFSAPVKIEYSTNGGNSYTTIVASAPNTGYYSWSPLPNTPSTNCLVRVSDAADGNPSDVSDAAFSIVTASLSLTTPNGGEQWQVGSQQQISWSSQNIPDNDVSIEYSTDNGQSYNFAGFQTNNQTTETFTWEVPNTPSSNCLVKISLYMGNVLVSDVSNAVFTITTAAPAGPVHFTFAANTNDSYSIVVDNATLDQLPLAVGDEIGIFTPAGLCVGASVWDGSPPLALTAWADDSQTPAVDGFVNGETMSFKIWDASANDDYKATPAYSSGNGSFNDGAFARISLLTAVSSITQTFALAQGWSWFSIMAQPDNPAMESVMAGLANVAIIVNGAGEFYIPNVINNIGNITVLEGYKIYLNTPGQLSITGAPTDDTTSINLNFGWNFISYLPSAAMQTETALASILNQLAIIKNDKGEFFIPNVINNMGSMYPGEGYKLYLNSESKLTYPTGGAFAKTTGQTEFSRLTYPRHYKFHGQTGESYSVVVRSVSVNGQETQAGDEIGIFTADGLCVGAGVWNGSGLLAIAAWADDDVTKNIDGFRDGDEMIFKYWNNRDKKESVLNADFSKGNATFGSGIYVMVDLESAGIPMTFSLEQNYPNPFNPATEIAFQLPESGMVELKIYNLAGVEILSLLNEHRDSGAHKIRWDGRDSSGNPVSSGIYIYHLKSGSFSAVKKATLIK